MNEQQRIEELLKPRYEVIADYPASPFVIGDVIFKGHPKYDYYFDFNKPINIERWPHIFKPLQWWEKRKAEEMPEYVKFLAPLPERYRIRKVVKWFDMGWDVVRCEDGIRYQLGVADLPATESEYTTFINTKTKEE